MIQKLDLKLNKNTIYSILSIVILLVGLLAASVVVRQRQLLQKKAAPATTLQLTTANLQPVVNDIINVAVEIDTGSNLVIGTELYLTFDQTMLEVQSFTPGPFLSGAQTRDTVLDNTNGKASNVIFIPLPGGTPQQGTGVVANLTFKTLATGTTTIGWEPSKSIVAAVGIDEGLNVLQTTIPLTINIGQPIADTILYLNTVNTTPYLGDPFDVTVDIDTGVNNVLATELAIQFDPNVLQVSDITPGTFFPNVVARDKQIDNILGTIFYVLYVPNPPVGQPQQGIGTVAVINFTSTQLGSTTIDWDATKTIVAAVDRDAGHNVIKQLVPLTITILTAPTPTPTSTPTPTPTPSCVSPRGDINNDCCVDLLDYSILFEFFGTTSPPTDPSVDLVPDNVINLLDYSVLFAHFGEGCTTPWPTNTPTPTGVSTPTPTPTQPDTGTATVSVSPPSSTIPSVGGTTTLDFDITAAERLGHFEFYVHYDPLVVQVASTSDVAEGSFLSSTGRTVTLLPPEIDNVAGNVKVGASSFGAADGPSGSGTLLSITFTAQGSGTSSIDIQNVLLVNSDPVPVVQPSTEVNGTITVGTTPTITPSPTPTQPDPGGNIAPLAAVSASSEYSSGFAAVNAVDGVIGRNGFGEWASSGEQNPWLQLDWSQSYDINQIIIYDRPNTIDHAVGGTLTFSDGSSVDVSGIPNSGAAHTVNFSSKTVTWVNFQVVGGTGYNVGLSEIEVF